MKYFTAKELTEDFQDETKKILGACAGPFVRYRFGVNIFRTWYQKIFKNKQDVKTLDLGAASGAFEVQLKEIGYTNVWGTDIDNYVALKNKELFKEFKTADLGRDPLPWSDKYFNIVTAWCVLPHLENPFLAIREVYRVLKPGGLFIFSVPHLHSKPAMEYFKKMGDFGSYRPTNNHLVMFTDGIIKKSVLKYFELLDTEYAVRTVKIFRGLKGGARKLFYNFVSGISPKTKKLIDRRWAYDAIYIVRKK